MLQKRQHLCGHLHKQAIISFRCWLRSQCSLLGQQDKPFRNLDTHSMPTASNQFSASQDTQWFGLANSPKLRWSKLTFTGKVTVHNKLHKGTHDECHSEREFPTCRSKKLWSQILHTKSDIKLKFIWANIPEIFLFQFFFSLNTDTFYIRSHLLIECKCFCMVSLHTWKWKPNKHTDIKPEQTKVKLCRQWLWSRHGTVEMFQRVQPT